MKINCVVYFTAVVIFLSCATKSKVFHKEAEDLSVTYRKPVLLVPGVLGSRLQAKLHNVDTGISYCDSTSDWYDIWLNLVELLPEIIDCWVYDISMHFPNGSSQARNQPGVETRVEDFGGTDAFEYLDSDHYAPGSPYFNKLVDYMVTLGYRKRDDLKGAPFDWRKTPTLSDTLLKNFTKLIEDNYYQHFNRKVVIIGHSMGNMFVYYYLKHQPQAWKDKFIDSFISINSPYLGSVKALKALTSGETEGHDIVLNKIKMRAASRNFPSSYLLLPNPTFWPKNKSEIVITFKKNYTVHEYESLFDHIECDQCWERWKYYGSEMGDLSAPNVEVHCVYSSQIPTAEALMYDPDLFPDITPVFITGSGDGTVNTFSSSYCLKWKEEQSQPVHDVLLPGNDHVDILSNVTLHKYIRDVVTAQPSLPTILKPDIL